MEYVIAYSTDSIMVAPNQAIVSERDVKLSASLHSRLSRRGVVYVYEHKPRAYLNRGRLVALATAQEWYPS